MKTILFFAITAVILTSCSSSEASDPIKYIGPSPYLVHDNKGGMIRDAGFDTSWVIKGFYKMFDEEIYAFYVVPTYKAHFFHYFYEKEKKVSISESGWVKLSDISENNDVCRVKNVGMYAIYEN